MKTNRSVPFFYDADPNPWGGGGAMVINHDNDTDTAVDDEPQEDTAEEPTDEVAKETPAEVKPEVKADPIIEPVKSAEPIIEPVKDWRETVSHDDLLAEIKKKFDRTALLKAAGIDEDTIKAIDFKESNGGDWNEYLRVKNTDYTKLAPEQLIEMNLRERKSGVDNKKFQILLKNELKKYNLDREEFAEDSEEAIIGEDALKEDADAIRVKFVEKQNSLKAPEKAPDTTAQDREISQTKITDHIRNSEAVKNLHTNKLIPYGAGDEAFNYEVTEVDRLVDATITAAIQNGQTPTDAEITKMVKTLAYHVNPEAVEKALIDHGKVIGTRNVRKDASNSQSNTETTSTVVENLTDAEILGRSGKVRNSNQ